ncbi:MAG: hypothetical protein ACTHJT_06640 [Cytophaga sp.]|uniref:hypothetical protein n=1 Tax=Cytophaga sp. TaxID=29535 RepID=UPI003F8013EA
MDIFDEEVLNLWKAFHKNKFQYIMVGGFATNLNGFSRTTADIDIWLKDTPQNRIHLKDSLAQMGLGDLPQMERMDFIPGWSSIRLNSGMELDLMSYIKGFEQETFDACYQSASTAVIFDIPIKFLHINHLIESKKACDRPKDKIDVLELERIKAERERL